MKIHFFFVTGFSIVVQSNLNTAVMNKTLFSDAEIQTSSRILLSRVKNVPPPLLLFLFCFSSHNFTFGLLLFFFEYFVPYFSQQKSSHIELDCFHPERMYLN